MARNFLTGAPPIKVGISVTQLGSNLRTARIRRRLTIEQVAESIGTGRRAVMDAERGKPTTSMVVYAALLWKYGLLENIAKLADPLQDETGLNLIRDKKRARQIYVPNKGMPSVYFIGDPKRKVVKIGKSNDVEKRLACLQTYSSGDQLEILAEIAFGTEAAAWVAERNYHVRFEHLRTHGEWFEVDSSLEKEIQSIRERSLICSAVGP